jgi:hypothetical protein
MNTCTICEKSIAPVDSYGDLMEPVCWDCLLDPQYGEADAQWPQMFTCEMRPDGVLVTRMTDEWKALEDALG